MAVYLFQLELPVITDEIAAVIPAQRACINAFFEEGKILSYGVSINRDMLWCFLESETEQTAMEIILKFPLHKYFTDIVCNKLLFYNTSSPALPGLSLN